MGEKSDQIEHEIRQQRNELSGNFDELEQKVKHLVDWRAQFDERPGTMIALAFGGGVLFSALFGRSVVRQRVYSDQRAASAPKREIVSAQASAPQASAPQMSSEPKNGKNADRRVSRETRHNLAAVRDAFVAMALINVSGVIDAVLPGFQNEFTKARASHSGTTYR
ncbi:MAG TPA: hypothetical protein VGF20_06655 [Candidatus Acidoferrum sp.]|jgi:uncharacterized iron-regulated membrane protein